jgi:hypothetical protein
MRLRFARGILAASGAAGGILVALVAWTPAAHASESQYYYDYARYDPPPLFDSMPPPFPPSYGTSRQHLPPPPPWSAYGPYGEPCDESAGSAYVAYGRPMPFPGYGAVYQGAPFW